MPLREILVRSNLLKKILSRNSSRLSNQSPNSYRNSATLAPDAMDPPKASVRGAFKNLKPLEFRTEDARDIRIPLGPADLKHGTLENGLTYYVKKNAKPQNRAALALGVRIGCVDISCLSRI